MNKRGTSGFHVMIVVILGIAAIGISFFTSLSGNNLASDVGNAVSEIDRQFEEGNRVLTYNDFLAKFTVCETLKESLKNGIVSGNKCINIEDQNFNRDECVVNEENFRNSFLNFLKQRLGNNYEGNNFGLDGKYEIDLSLGEKFLVFGKSLKPVFIEGMYEYSVKPDFKVEVNFNFSYVEDIYKDIEEHAACLYEFNELEGDNPAEECGLRHKELKIDKIGDKVIAEASLDGKICNYDSLIIKFVYDLTPSL